MSKFGYVSLFRSTLRTFKRSARLVYCPDGVVHPPGEKWAFPSRNDALGPANQRERALLFEMKMYVNKWKGLCSQRFVHETKLKGNKSERIGRMSYRKFYQRLIIHI